jgi:hypothetical protein
MPSRKSLKLPRRKACLIQQFRCYYCQLSMWDGDPQPLCQATGLSPKQARSLQCTAEHLIPWSCGGTNDTSNIVAACLRCNLGRHRRKLVLPHEKYKELVRRRVARQKWHDRAILDSANRISCYPN